MQYRLRRRVGPLDQRAEGVGPGMRRVGLATDLFLIRDNRPRPLRAATQVGRPISLSASDRDEP
jgi:hypothetical protein